MKKTRRSKGQAGMKRRESELMIGGQAVIEGVMMRNKDHFAVAVRDPKNRIIVKKQVFKSKTVHSRILGLPFMRGIIMLFETLILGMKALNFSAGVGLEEHIPTRKEMEKGLIFTFIISFIFAIALFKFLPLLAATYSEKLIGENNFLFNLVDGLTKLAILVIYLLLISLMADVRRLFQYHGAEHKSVACYEAGAKLTVANVKKHKKEHPRCGTSFIMVVILFSIIFYMVIPMNLGFLAKLGMRILLLPLIAGASYEIIRLAGRHNNWVTRALVYPGILVQNLTTREPDGKQIEVAIESLKAVLGKKNV